MNTFTQILLYPGAALILADKLSGRMIGRIADGFDADPALYDMMNLYRAIEDKWPTQILSLREMYELQLKDAGKETASSDEALEGLTPEQREAWLQEPTRTSSRKDRLKKALPKIVDLYSGATPDLDSWDNLEPINQWSLLNATEKELHKRLKRYKAWAKEAEAAERFEADSITLRNDAEEALKPLFDIITDFLSDKEVAKALKQDLANGIRVPARMAS